MLHLFPDKYHMLVNDVEEIRQVIYAENQDFRDLNTPPDTPDPALVTAVIEKHPEYKGRPVVQLRNRFTKLIY